VGVAAPAALEALTEEDFRNRTVWEKFAFFLYDVYKKENKKDSKKSAADGLSHKTACDYFNNAFAQPARRYASTTPFMGQYDDGDGASAIDLPTCVDSRASRGRLHAGGAHLSRKQPNSS